MLIFVYQNKYFYPGHVVWRVYILWKIASLKIMYLFVRCPDDISTYYFTLKLYEKPKKCYINFVRLKIVNLKEISSLYQ